MMRSVKALDCLRNEHDDRKERSFDGEQNDGANAHLPHFGH